MDSARASYDSDRAYDDHASAGVDRAQCGSHEARLTNLEKWMGRLDARFWAIIIGITATLALQAYNALARKP